MKKLPAQRSDRSSNSRSADKAKKPRKAEGRFDVDAWEPSLLERMTGKRRPTGR